MSEKDQPSELQQSASAPPIAEKRATQEIEWPRLLARLVEGIVTSELHEFEDNVLAFLDSVVSNIRANIIWTFALTIGAGFVLTGAILFLGRFVPWWEAFGIVGLVVIAVGAVASSGGRRPERHRSRRR
jgi:hypothetical protein